MSFSKDDSGLEEYNQYDALDNSSLSVAETQALYHVAQSLIISPNLSELLHAIVNTIAETLPANRVTLIIFDLDAHQISHFVKGGIGIDDVVNVTFGELWDGLTGWSLRKLKPALSPKSIPDIRESGAVQHRRIETNCGAIIVVPLHYQNTILGTLTAINRPEERDFTKRDVALMMVIANQSAIAIQNALLVKNLQLANEALEQRVRERTAELAKANAHLQQEIAERKQAEEERRTHLWFLESMDQVNRAIQGTTDFEQMLKSVLDVALTIFDCDRAWLVYPCDPDALTWQVPMERSRLEYPGVLPIGVELPLDPSGASVYRILRASLKPVQFGPTSAHTVPKEMVDAFGVKSFIATAFYPKLGQPWAFGLHQCSYSRVWTSTEERLLQEIGRRMSDALTSLVAYQNLQTNERKLIDAQRIAHVGHWDWDGVHNHLKWSDETYRIFGLEPQGEPINLDRLKELIHPQDFDMVAKALADAEAGIKPFDVEYRIVKPNGTIRSIYNLGEVLFDQNRKPIGMFGTLMDVTERKQAQEELQRKFDEEAELQAYLKTLHKISIELTLIDRADDFYKQVIQLGLEQLGFDRMGLFLYDPERNMALGTYGTDTQGHLMPESHIQFVLEPHGSMWNSLIKPDRFFYEEAAPLHHNQAIIGTGWKVAVALWFGNRNLGWLVVDNLIHQQPISKAQLEVLAQYGMYIAAALARKQAEEKLRTSENRYRSLIQKVQTAIVLHSSDGRILDINPLAQRLLKLSRDQLLGKLINEPIWHFLREDGSEMPVSEYPVSLVLSYEQPVKDYVVGIQHSDSDKPIWALVNAEPEYNDGRKITQIIVSFVEITERKRAQEALHRQNEYFAALYETTLSIMNRLNTTELLNTILNRAIALVGTSYGSIFLFSPDKTSLTAAIYTGYPKDLPLRHAEIGKGLSGTVWQTGKTVVINDYQNWPKRSFGVIPDTICANLGIPLKSKDELIGILCVDYHEKGRIFTEDDVAILSRFAALASIALVNAQLYDSVQQELEERKQVELRLQRYNKRLSILRDIDHKILFASSPQAIANVVLKYLAELIPCEFLSVILHDPELTEERIFALRHTPDLGGVYTEEIQPVVQNEVLEKLKSGKTAIAPDLLQQAGPHAHLAEELEAHGVRSALASPMIIQDRLIGTIALAAREVGFFTSEHQEITEEVSAQIAIALQQAELKDQLAQYNEELEQRVRERTTQLEHANRELELFSYSVSHDLRAPLRAIQGFAEIIVRRHRATLNEEAARYFDNIVLASEQMNQLIIDLLAYARLGRGGMPRLRAIALDSFLAEVITNLTPQIVEAQAQIHVAEALPIVLGDNTLLKQIFTNLLENAIIYHRVGVPPVIDISYTIEAEYAIIRVIDNGIGIPAEFHEKIFHIFQRLYSQDQYPGTGIGLAIVRKSVEMLNGSVWVELKEGQGSVFCVKLKCGKG